ncbi:MAG TPA: NADH-quinone oxidoreductase subunit N [Lacipirellulaceae bacterium]|nr:NADH-quinone oxidoreductase subunit N [Lacipirellulaceae bacterium]
MNLHSLTEALTSDTLHTSLPRFMPELVICVTIVVMLLARMPRFLAWIDPFIVALLGVGVALYYAIPEGGLSALETVQHQELFTGMLVYDSMTAFFRLFLLSFAFLFIILVRLTGLADRQDGQDFYTLLLGSTLGMCLMASANHLMTVFLAVEMASVPSYVMAGILKGRRRASEASLKYAVYGAGAAGVMLYGISLLAGLTGSAHLPSIAAKLAAMDIPAQIASGNGGTIMVLVLAGLMIMVGLAFKLSAVPFHFWCPDVFEGASAEVDAFLSVASKAAAMALLLRVAIGLSTAPTPAAPTAQHAIPAHTVALEHNAGEAASAAMNPATRFAAAESSTPLAPVRHFIVILLAILAAVTCTFGNLAAYGQTNIKRLLAYSTIAHAGYMIMAIAAAVQLSGTNVAGAREAVAALLFYLMAYLFMNLGAFAIVAFLRNTLGTEEIADYAGLIRSAPFTAVTFTTILISLVGIPPMIGFMGKFAIFNSLVVAGGFPMIALLVIAGINTAISLVYYLRVAKVMCIDAPPADRGPVWIGVLPVVFMIIIAVPVLVYGIVPAHLLEIARAATQQLIM